MSELRSPFLIPGETWFPQKPASKVKPRQIIWTGYDDQYGLAVRWVNPKSQESSVMQEKAFRWWITKHDAKI